MRLIYRLFWLVPLGLLTSCALLSQVTSWHPPLVLPPDTTGQPVTYIVAKNFYGGTYKDRSDRRAAEGGTFVAKANAPVASGTSQAQDFTRAGQQGGAVATAPDASARATPRPGVPGWALAAAGLVLLLLGLAYKFRAYWPRLP